MAQYAAMLTRSVAAAAPPGALACFCCDEIDPTFFAASADLFRFPVPQTIGVRELGRVFKAPRVMTALRRQLEAWSPDILHVNSGHLWYSALIPAWSRRYPLVATLHDISVHPGEWRPYEGLKRRPLLRYARRLLVHSESLRQEALRQRLAPAERWEVVPHGLPPLPLAPRTRPVEQPFQVLFAGRLYAYKGLEILLQAWPEVLHDCPSARLVVAGAGRLAGGQRALRSLSSTVRVIHRYLDDREMADLFAQSAVVALPYIEASQSGVALAAAAFGKAVVASRVGAIPEAVRHNETGLLVEPGNGRELAAAILRLLQHPEERRRLGRAAAEQAQMRFGPEPIGRRLLEIYHAAMREAGGSTAAAMHRTAS